MHNKYQPIIGLEIHVELKTNAKMFCQCPADYFGKPPNTQTCPVCLGMPGALPVPNKKAIEWTQLIGKALNCQVSTTSKFDRKHYFYPDLPKGYQISQYDKPIASKGWLKSKVKSQKSKTEEKQYRIRRVHIEEDTGKLIHQGNETLIDFNRSGVPLVEIVTEPDFDNSDDVKQFLEELQVLIRYLEVADCDMEKGSMRLEPNISLQEIRNPKSEIRNKSKILNSRDKNGTLPNYKVEVKNINSFRFVKQAIEYEIKRQSEILEKGEIPKQETRGFDERKNETYAQRTKEEAHDYRYFPEPDIPPMVFDENTIEWIQERLPVLPHKKIERYVNMLHIKYEDAYVLTREKWVSDKFDAVIAKLPKQYQKKISPQWIANLFINKRLKELSLHKTEEQIIKEVCASYDLKGKISTFMDNLSVVNSAIKKIIDLQPKAVQDYKKGKKNSVMFLVGQVMKEMQGKADPQTVRRKLEEAIEVQS